MVRSVAQEEKGGQRVTARDEMNRNKMGLVAEREQEDKDDPRWMGVVSHNNNIQ